MGQEWAHPELACQGNRLHVAPLGLFHIGWIAVRSDLAEQAEGIGLVPPFLVAEGKIESAGRQLDGLLDLTGHEVSLAEVSKPYGMADLSRGAGLGRGLLEKGQGVGEAPGEEIGVAQA